MPQQTTHRVLMIRPAAFGFNPETARSNTFQKNQAIADASELAIEEFEGLTEALASNGIQVEVVQDTSKPAKRDAVFPNNWVSFHEGGRAVLYPMANPSRQAEVRPEIVRDLGYEIFLDLRKGANGKALEGTGSLVLDRVAGIGYACLSPRTDQGLLDRFSEAMGIRIITFRAEAGGSDIYHTNVVMALGERLAVICRDAITEPTAVLNSLRESGKDVLEIDVDQMNQFAGNMLELKGAEGNRWVMSQSAISSLSLDQLELFLDVGAIAVDIPTIETLGGGSVRCMIAELF